MYPAAEIDETRLFNYKDEAWYANAIANAENNGIILTTPRYNDISGHLVVSLLSTLFEPKRYQ